MLLGAQVLWTGALGCGDTEAEPPPHQPELLGTAGSPLRVRNGMTSNGLITNGLITNGLITNGLITSGVSTSSFDTWFNANPPEYSDMVMKYVVACAYAQRKSLTYKNATTGVTYTWPGVLGLTPGWSSGLPITRDEEQLISACLAVHVNKFGINMEVSVRGETATGTTLSVTKTESTDFSEKEAAFFGNLFTGEGVFACNDRQLNHMESSARACGLVSQSSGTSIECPPIEHVGGCGSACSPGKSDNTYYASCTINGRTYKPLTTRIRPSDIYRCGDGVCQISESCDPDPLRTGSTYNACESDCGNCLN